MKRLKVLISAFYCEPGTGSEEGTGWNAALEMARYHEVWVLTRSTNRSKLETEKARGLAPPNLRFAYYDLPSWTRWWVRGQLIEWHLYYYLWQICIYFLARRLHHKIGFDIVHHVTFVKYWIPSFLVFLPVPLIWGPVGGGEQAPKTFWRDWDFRGRASETLRDIGRWLGEHDLFLRLTTRRSASAWATTEETAARMRKLRRATDVHVFAAVGLPKDDLEQLSQYPIPTNSSGIRLISIGRLLHWKGFHLGLRAFARANLPEVEYWIVGEGSERDRLEVLSRRLKVADQVRFFGALPRDETLSELGKCHILVHPSLHDSGGISCLEAMAAGRPVVCLALGGPAVLLTEEAGIKVSAFNPEQVVHDLANAITSLVQNPELRNRMGEAGRRRVSEAYNWETKGQFWARHYEDILSQR